MVVLSWNGLDDTVACLRSLAEVCWPRRDVILVDNGSSDGTPETVRREFPDVDVIANPSNVGFSAANNLGIERALAGGCDWVFILNNDTVLARDVVEQLIAAAEAHPGAGILSPLIYFSDPPDLVWFGGARFDPSRGRSGRMEHYRRRLPVGFGGVRPIDRAAGAAMLVSRQAIEQVGPFDPELFFLHEDVDLSLRVHAAGFELLLVPTAQVWHRVAASQDGRERTPLTSYYGLRNNLLVCERHAPLPRVAAWRRELACVGTHVAGLRRAERPAANLRAILAGWRDFHRRRFGPRLDDGRRRR
jgi:GT2 family glycosyltransferase